MYAKKWIAAACWTLGVASGCGGAAGDKSMTSPSGECPRGDCPAIDAGTDEPTDEPTDKPSMTTRDASRPPSTREDARQPDVDRDSGQTSKPDAQVISVGDSGPQWILGYYVGYEIDRYPLSAIDWASMTHVAFAPLKVRSNGNFDTTFFNFGSDAEGKAFAKQLSDAAHAHGVKALLMLGGAGASEQIKPWLGADKDGFVKALIALANELGYDGIDLDIEATNFTLDDFVTLASALRAAAPKMLITMPGASIQLGQKVDARTVKIATYLDRYFIQSYQGGNHGLFTGGNGAGQRFESWFYTALDGISALRPYTIGYALEQLAAAGIPKAKLGMGIAFYAGCYKIPDTSMPNGGDVTAPRMPTSSGSDWCWDCGVGGGDGQYSLTTFFSSSSVFAKSSAGEQKWDDTAQMPYLSFAAAKQDAACGGKTRYVIYEDERSLQAKGKFSRDNGYGGTIIWTIAQGYLPADAAGKRSRTAIFDALRMGFLGK